MTKRTKVTSSGDDVSGGCYDNDNDDNNNDNDGYMIVMTT